MSQRLAFAEEKNIDTDKTVQIDTSDLILHRIDQLIGLFDADKFEKLQILCGIRQKLLTSITTSKPEDVVNSMEQEIRISCCNDDQLFEDLRQQLIPLLQIAKMLQVLSERLALAHIIQINLDTEDAIERGASSIRTQLYIKGLVNLALKGELEDLKGALVRRRDLFKPKAIRPIISRLDQY